ncbi:hypothetical protein NDU88_001017 [Pleurodeles waltl]|uniref:Uncharacterized protein n=1 Tax=Pleurodeles waltl TaxID=8319 RepID=A0AAV7USW1_PLEWA|nr:hypothetical protein NDU88_001017 [Pleurodeles waltl]
MILNARLTPTRLVAGDREFPPLLGPLPDRLCIRNQRPGGCSRASARRGEYEARQRRGLPGKRHGESASPRESGHDGALSGGDNLCSGAAPRTKLEPV